MSDKKEIVSASPKVRKLAREFGADIYQIEGSQRKGRLSEEDVKSFSKSDCSGIVIGSAIVEKVTESVKKNEDKHIVANVIKEYCKKLIKNLN